MILNETTMALAAAEDPWITSQQNALPIPLLQPEQVATAVAVAGERRGRVHHRYRLATRCGPHRPLSAATRSGRVSCPSRAGHPSHRRCR